MGAQHKKMAAMVASLSEEDFSFLQDCVRMRREGAPAPSAPRALPPFAVADSVRHLEPEALARVEAAFARRVEEARNGQQRLSRLRVWLVFLLLRHAGLRLAEARGFNDREDVDVRRSLLLVRGPYAREVPLPPPVLERVRGIINAVEAQGLRGELTLLDEGYLRRCLYARARECGVPGGLLSARSLRNTRAIELCRSGMPLKIVDAFLGQSSNDRTAAFLQYSEQDAKAIIHYYLHREMKMKTSARNVFPGRVSRLLHSGILVEVTLTTFSGLEVVAVITEESARTLALEEGKTVIATVKAPWVILARPEETPTLDSARNRFPGTVARVTRSEVASEVVVDLAEGSRVCALITTESAGKLELEEGEPALVLFKAFSVILALE